MLANIVTIHYIVSIWKKECGMSLSSFLSYSDEDDLELSSIRLRERVADVFYGLRGSASNSDFMVELMTTWVNAPANRKKVKDDQK